MDRHLHVNGMTELRSWRDSRQGLIRLVYYGKYNFPRVYFL